jgi:hypothetical protein
MRFVDWLVEDTEGLFHYLDAGERFDGVKRYTAYVKELKADVLRCFSSAYRDLGVVEDKCTLFYELMRSGLIPIGDRCVRQTEDQKQKWFSLNDTVAVEHEHCFSYIFDIIRMMAFCIRSADEGPLQRLYMGLFFPTMGDVDPAGLVIPPFFSARVKVNMKAAWSVEASKYTVNGVHGLFNLIRQICWDRGVSSVNPGPRWSLGKFDKVGTKNRYTMKEFKSFFRVDIMASPFGSQTFASSFPFSPTCVNSSRSRMTFILLAWLMKVVSLDNANAEECVECLQIPGLDKDKFWTNPVGALPHRSVDDLRGYDSGDSEEIENTNEMLGLITLDKQEKKDKATARQEKRIARRHLVRGDQKEEETQSKKKKGGKKGGKRNRAEAAEPPVDEGGKRKRRKKSPSAEPQMNESASSELQIAQRRKRATEDVVSPAEFSSNRLNFGLSMGGKQGSQSKYGPRAHPILPIHQVVGGDDAVLIVGGDDVNMGGDGSVVGDDVASVVGGGDGSVVGRDDVKMDGDGSVVGGDDDIVAPLDGNYDNRMLMSVDPAFRYIDDNVSLAESESVEANNVICHDRKQTTELMMPKLYCVNSLKEGWAPNFINYCKEIENQQFLGDTNPSRRVVMIPKWITSSAKQSEEKQCQYWLDGCFNVVMYHWHGVMQSSESSLAVGYLCLNHEESDCDIRRFFVERVQRILECGIGAKMYVLASEDDDNHLAVVLVPSDLGDVFGWELNNVRWNTGDLPAMKNLHLILVCDDVFKSLNKWSMGLDSMFCNQFRSLFGDRVPFLYAPSMVNMFSLSVLSYLIGLIADSDWCRDKRLLGDIGVHFLMGSEFMVFLESTCPTRAAQRLAYMGSIVNMGAQFRQEEKTHLVPALGMIVDSYATVADLNMVNASIVEQTQHTPPKDYRVNLHPDSRRTVFFFYSLLFEIVDQRFCFFRCL